MPPELLVLGCGYAARVLARDLIAQGWRVTGTTRSPEGAAALQALGITPVIWPGDDAGLAAALERAGHVLASAAPGPAGDPFIEALRPRLLGMRPRWLGYFSTTGVYGDAQGGWVDEDTPLNPATPRGAARVMTERQWQVLAREGGHVLTVFRLPGIYGPGRSAFDRLRSGEARSIVKPGQVFSRVHVADIARFVAATLAAPRPAVWNLCDDEPAPPQDVLAHAARLLGLPPPPEVPLALANLSPMAASFYAESKRVSNARIKAALGLDPLYPSYREGLAAILAEGG